MQEMLCKDVTSRDEISANQTERCLYHLTDAMACFSTWVMSCPLHFVQEVELEKFREQQINSVVLNR